MVNPDVKDHIIQYLILNHGAIKERLQEYKGQRDAYLIELDPVFHGDVKDGFLSLAKTIITEEVGRRYALSPEEVLVVLESFDLEEYLR